MCYYNSLCRDIYDNVGTGYTACVQRSEYSWWGVWFTFFVVVCTPMLIGADAANKYGSCMQGFIAACMSVTMIDLSIARNRMDDGVNARDILVTLLDMLNLTPSMRQQIQDKDQDFQTAWKVVFAGFIVSTVAMGLMLFGISAAMDDTPAPSTHQHSEEKAQAANQA
ncbi:hypothetical protein HYH03_011163 [Edaphochlamys debaryana]|uniref:Uncharacterized protein n=1 Tax=Edaphochlamys debaryana TaxID=47281 RepID=A0A836BV81_9CHLO|nr:hypothetical protein HYH03_011163 [Edaphochlamys debaryana]|eukprot:KAG2490361.1 hypothetical protein HYH03_011163 [Edaphochlamys debaryana]